MRTATLEHEFTFNKRKYQGANRGRIPKAERLLCLAGQFVPTTEGNYFRCAYQGTPLTPPEEVDAGFPSPQNGHKSELDHIIPKSRGGEDHALNYQYLSHQMNKTKLDRITPHVIFEANRRGLKVESPTMIADVFALSDEAQAMFDLVPFGFPFWHRDVRGNMIRWGYSPEYRGFSTEESILSEWAVKSAMISAFILMNPSVNAQHKVEEQFYANFGERPFDFLRKSIRFALPYEPYFLLKLIRGRLRQLFLKKNQVMK